MRVGVDGACFANRRGYGRFARELLTAIVAAAPDDEFHCFVDTAARAAIDLTGPNVRMIDVPQRVAPTAAAAADGHRSMRDMLAFTRATRTATIDVVFFPSVYTYFPLPPRRAGVVVVHDTIIERHPDDTLPSRRSRLLWSAKMRLALRQCRSVLTVSDYSARDVHEVLGVATDRISVVGEAPAAAFRPSTAHEVAEAAARIGLPPNTRWIIYVGGFGPHKNVPAIVRAHASLVERLSEPVHLVLVGAVDDDPFFSDRAAILDSIAASGTGALTVWTGFLPDDELRPLLGGAISLLLPSAREGFGLPAVEAAACATPVIATTCSPLPTLLEGGGVFVRPGDDDGLTAALVHLATDDADRVAMGRTALARAGRMSWDAAAMDALAAIRREAG